MTELQLLANVSRLVDDRGRIRHADVEAHRIAALVAGGMTTQDVLQDYPNLDRAQVDAAILYARANPKPDQTYPRRTAKSASRHEAGGGLSAAFAAARDPDDA